MQDILFWIVSVKKFALFFFEPATNPEISWGNQNNMIVFRLYVLARESKAVLNCY